MIADLIEITLLCGLAALQIRAWKKEKKMSKAVDDLVLAVTELTTVNQSAIALIEGFSQQVLDAKDDPIRIEQVVAQLRENKTKLAAAVSANTAPGIGKPENPPSTPPPSALPSASFTATPSSVISGSPATLSWSGLTGATSASIDNGVGAVDVNSPSGSVTVSPTSTTSYALTLTGPGGTNVLLATVTVT